MMVVVWSSSCSSNAGGNVVVVGFEIGGVFDPKLAYPFYNLPLKFAESIPSCSLSDRAALHPPYGERAPSKPLSLSGKEKTDDDDDEMGEIGEINDGR